jgi:Zn-dependent M28 family amino/carboxypeptidase
MERAAQYIRRELESGGAAVTEQPFPGAGTVVRNLIASFGPDTRERVIVGAHYDAAGGFPGADDNASSVAGLIELVPLLRSHEFRRRVELVAYAFEEAPFFATPEMGSVVHARALRAAGARVTAMLSLEMIGYYTDAPDSQKFPFRALKLIYPTRGNFVVVAGRFSDLRLVRRIRRSMKSVPGLAVESIVGPRSLPGIDLSDNASYWDVGDPAVMITDSAFYRNPNYHLPSDTPETLDYVRMARVVEGIARAVMDLADTSPK